MPATTTLPRRALRVERRDAKKNPLHALREGVSNRGRETSQRTGHGDTGVLLPVMSVMTQLAGGT